MKLLKEVPLLLKKLTILDSLYPLDGGQNILVEMALHKMNIPIFLYKKTLSSLPKMIQYILLHLSNDVRKGEVE
ncbi:hypothetical protein CHH83_06095 [Bacillus sp. 7586-K]|nr:hypothetical protein CHH83_06095 [Bacillus sp. 7586-K]